MPLQRDEPLRFAALLAALPHGLQTRIHILTDSTNLGFGPELHIA